MMRGAQWRTCHSWQTAATQACAHRRVRCPMTPCSGHTSSHHELRGHRDGCATIRQAVVWLRLQTVWKAAACTGSQLEALLQRRVCMHAKHVVCVCAEQMVASANDAPAEGRVHTINQRMAREAPVCCCDAVIMGPQKSSVQLIESKMHSYETYRKEAAKLNRPCICLAWSSTVQAETNRRSCHLLNVSRSLYCALR
jgi:hypothetical protein